MFETFLYISNYEYLLITLRDLTTWRTKGPRRQGPWSWTYLIFNPFKLAISQRLLPRAALTNFHNYPDAESPITLIKIETSVLSALVKWSESQGLK